MSFKIIHKYIFKILLRNFFFGVLTLTVLFLLVDIFDRIDVIMGHNADFWVAAQYFLFKTPQFLITALPIGFVIAVLFTYGLLSKSSEITAMRSAGMKISYLARPLIFFGIILSLLNLLLNETVLPFTLRRVKEIYNIDIQKKDASGAYSQENIWWRDGSQFYSAAIFDSRDRTLHSLALFSMDPDFETRIAQTAGKAEWVNKELGWSMFDITEYKFKDESVPEPRRLLSLPLPIKKSPTDFYDTEMDPLSMNFRQLRKFIKEQQASGLSTAEYYSDFYAKFSFPFVVLISAFAVLPFAIKPARGGSLASSFFAGIFICFCYYAVHSFSLALGRAEIIPPLAAAWMANLILLAAGLILFNGAEAPE